VTTIIAIQSQPLWTRHSRLKWHICFILWLKS